MKITSTVKNILSFFSNERSQNQLMIDCARETTVKQTFVNLRHQRKKKGKEKDILFLCW